MNYPSTHDSQSLLSDEELHALMQRKASIQESLQKGEPQAGACSTSMETCPGCGCGSQDSAALPTRKSHQFQWMLVALAVTGVAWLLWGM